MKRGIAHVAAGVGVAASLLAAGTVPSAVFAEPVPADAPSAADAGSISVDASFTVDAEFVPVATSAQEQQAQLQQLVDKIVKDLRPNVTAESWVTSLCDNALNSAYLVLRPRPDGAPAPTPVEYERVIGELEAARAQLVPGQNLSLFTEPMLDTIDGMDSLGQSDAIRAHWLDAGHSAKNPGYRANSMRNAVNGVATNPAAFTRLGKAGDNAPVYIQMDLGSVQTITGFKLWRDWSDGAVNANTALVVANKEDFSDKQVVYYSKDTAAAGNAADDDVFKLGMQPVNALYAETKGGTNLMADKAPVSGRYIRLYLNGSTEDVGGENRIVEMAIEGGSKPAAQTVYDTTALRRAIDEATAYLAAHRDEATPETAAAMQRAIDEATQKLEAIRKGDASEPLGVVDSLIAKIEGAQDALVPQFYITFDDQVDGTDNERRAVQQGSQVAMPKDPARTGYLFKGWFLDPACTQPFDATAPVNASMTVYAKWQRVTGPLPFDPQETPQLNPPVDQETKPQDDATVTPQNVPDATPEQKPSDAKPNGGQTPEGVLPKTGDPAMGMAMLSALGSVTACVAARRRK